MKHRMKRSTPTLFLAAAFLFGVMTTASSQIQAQTPASPAKVAPAVTSPASPPVAPAAPRKASVPVPEWLGKEIGKPLRLQGEGTLRIIGFRIYNARLWVPGAGFTFDNDFALDITYAQGTDKQGLVLATVPELGRFMPPNSPKLDQWTNDLRRVYPDIEAGDRFIAVWRKDQNVTRFFHNDKPTGDVMGVDFGKAFFSIWLDPQTRRPELRRALLSE
jgi:cell wall-associated NlpC family hydrolase